MSSSSSCLSAFLCGMGTQKNHAVTHVEEVFARHARLDLLAFFNALASAGYGDYVEKDGQQIPVLSTSPFANVVFRDYCDDNDELRGVGTQKLGLAVKRLSACRLAFRSCSDRGSQGVAQDRFPQLLLALMSQLKEGQVGETADREAAEVRKHLASANIMTEAFRRWDSDNSGFIEEDECLLLGLSLLAIASVYHFAGAETGLTKESYAKVLVKLGFVDVARSMKGALIDSVYDRLDTDANGKVGLPEFWVGASRLLRPVFALDRLTETKGWPGWQGWEGWGKKLQAEGISKLSECIQTLRTGDIILVKMDDPFGRFLQFSCDTPFNHLAVVVRHAARPGVPNECTEALLEQYPFRRRSHQFCSPGYCRCFSSSSEDKYMPSQFNGGGVSLLESTGEGIHVYDFAHRLFETSYAKEVKVVAVRRLEGVTNRDDTAQVESFIEKVRGHLYMTNTKELASAVRHVNSSDHDEIADDSTFCSKLVAGFYRHMGWLASNQSINIMPCDWDDPPSALAQPVQLTMGKLGPVEIVRGSASEKME